MLLLYIRYYLHFLLRFIRQTCAPTIIGIRTDRLKLDDLNNDVLLIICDYLDVPTWLPNNGRSPGIKHTPLKNLSRVNRRMRALLRPIIMQSIASIELEPPKKNGERPDGWATVHKTIEGITQDSFLLRTVRYLQLSYWHGHAWKGKDCDHLVTFLRRLPNLSSLDVSIPDKMVLSLEVFLESEAAKEPITFPNLTTLCIDTRTTCLAAYAPHLKHLAIRSMGNGWSDGSRRIISDLRQMQHKYDIPLEVRHLEAHADWTLEEVPHLAARFPEITRLAVIGYGSRPDQPHFAPFITALRRYFTELSILDLPSVDCLNVGFRPMRCGTPFVGPGGQEALRRYEDSRQTALNRAAGMAFAACAGLRECWIGEGNVARVVSRGGTRIDGREKQGMRYESWAEDEGEDEEEDDGGPGGGDGAGRADDDYLDDPDPESDDEGDTKAVEELRRAAEGIRWVWSSAGEEDFVRREGRLLHVS
jgi:hypothetical protein